jgi:hypothetical protein
MLFIFEFLTVSSDMGTGPLKAWHQKLFVLKIRLSMNISSFMRDRESYAALHSRFIAACA